LIYNIRRHPDLVRPILWRRCSPRYRKSCGALACGRAHPHGGQRPDLLLVILFLPNGLASLFAVFGRRHKAETA
jgi:hypothetical protein